MPKKPIKIRPPSPPPPPPPPIGELSEERRVVGRVYVRTEGGGGGHFLLCADGSGPLYCLSPSVEGTEQLAAIPEHKLPFNGYPVTEMIVVEEQNRTLLLGDGAAVLGLGRYTIALNGVTVYSPPPPVRHATGLLVAASEALQRLRLHPIQWWEPASYERRPVWYQGIPAVIVEFEPLQGRVWLAPEPGYSFVADGPEIDQADQDRLPMVAVDILFGGVLWSRTRTPESPTVFPYDENANTPEESRQ